MLSRVGTFAAVRRMFDGGLCATATAATAIAAALLVAVAAPLAADGAETVPLPPAYTHEFADGFAGSELVFGSEGEIWGTVPESGQIERVETSGVVTGRFTIPSGSGQDEPVESAPRSIVRGNDGEMWFLPGRNSEGSPLVERINAVGSHQGFLVAHAGFVTGLSVGLEGNVWFVGIVGPETSTEQAVAGYLGHGGTPTTYTIPTGEAANLPEGSGPTGLVTAADGSLWFGDDGRNFVNQTLVGRVSPGGSIVEFPFPEAFSSVSEVTRLPDGEVWVEAGFGGVYRVSPSGAFMLVGNVGPFGGRLAPGPEGNVWFYAGLGEVGRISPTGQVRVFTGLPEAAGSMVVGADGALWYAARGGGLVRVTVPPAPALLTAPTVSGAAAVGALLEASVGSWSHEPTSYSYQWQVCDPSGVQCEDIPGATGSTLTVGATEVGRTVRVAVSAANLGGTTVATSAPIGPIPVPSPGPPPVHYQPLPEITAGMVATFARARRFAEFSSMVLSGVPGGAIVEVVCHGRGCPFRGHRVRIGAADTGAICGRARCSRARTRGELDLTPLWSGVKLWAGTHVSVIVIKANWVGKSFQYLVREGNHPRVTIGCLAPNSRTKTERC
jgi:streptogramin lyase